jgi:NAD(P)-dependent dehydrogenase (short-subunit alcohol dehydrogenase family)
MAKRVLVVGAGGDVGQGVAAVLLEKGYEVVAAGREKAKLEKMAAGLKTKQGLRLLTGSVEDEARAKALVAEAGPIDAAVVSVNAPVKPMPLADVMPDDLIFFVRANLLTHVAASRAILPALGAGGVLIGIGGGMADFVFPNLGHASMLQAAIRNYYRALAGEYKGPAVVRELLIASMVNGESKRAIADPRWITDRDIGEHAAAIIADPALFPEAVVTLRSRKQVGQPPEPKA